MLRPVRATPCILTYLLTLHCEHLEREKAVDFDGRSHMNMHCVERVFNFVYMAMGTRKAVRKVKVAIYSVGHYYGMLVSIPFSIEPISGYPLPLMNRPPPFSPSQPVFIYCIRDLK